MKVSGQWSVASRQKKVVALLILPALCSFVGCSKKPETAEAGGGAGAKGPAAPVGTVVTVAPVTTGSISKTVEVTGSLVALQDVVVGAKMAGRLATVTPHEGDAVTAGQVVATMDTADLNAQVAQAQANIAASLTKEQQAQAALISARQALQQSRNAVQNAQTNYQWTDKTTAASVATAKSALQSAQENLSTVKEGARTQEREQAQASVSSAKANFEKSRSDLKRYQQLFREGAASQSQLDQYQAAFDSAQATYTSAQSALSLLQEGARPQDIRRAELAVAQARDTLTRAEADRAQISMRQEDIQNAKAGVQSAQANVKSAEAGIRAARAGTEQANAALRIAQSNLSYAYITSPISGYVAERRAEPGSQLGGGGAVLRIVNPASVYFQAVLPESQYAEVHVGQTAAVSVDALPDTSRRPVTGRVTRVLPVASAARSFTVRIDFPGDRRMRPQMFARGSVLINTHSNAVLVPKDAVIFDPVNNRTRIMVAGGKEKAEERKVQTGYTNPQSVEIINGSVKPGEKVITLGQAALQDGDPIKVQ